MMRKQLIRVGFDLSFPENCAALNPETLEETDDDGSLEEAEQITDEPSHEALQQVADDTKARMEPKNKPAPDRSADQETIITALADYLPEDDIEAPDSYDEAEAKIHAMKIEIGRLFLKEKSLKLKKEEIEQIFV